MDGDLRWARCPRSLPTLRRDNGTFSAPAPCSYSFGLVHFPPFPDLSFSLFKMKEKKKTKKKTYH